MSRPGGYRSRDSQPCRQVRRAPSETFHGLGWSGTAGCRHLGTNHVERDHADAVEWLAHARANHVSVPSSDPSSGPASVPPSGHDRSTRSRAKPQVRRLEGSSVYWSDSIRYACMHASRPFSKQGLSSVPINNLQHRFSSPSDSGSISMESTFALVGPPSILWQGSTPEGGTGDR